MSMQLTIRSIQHYLYCPHRWGMVEIDRKWQENALVVKGNLVHNRVDSGLHDFKSAKKTVVSSLYVYHDEWDIYGVADCVEFVRDKAGVFLEQLGDRYSVNIIEYKPTQPKSSKNISPEHIQLFAQKLCADWIFGVESRAYFYYANTKKRVYVEFGNIYDSCMLIFLNAVQDMRNRIETGSIPPIEKGQRCNSCSMKDLCMPKARTSFVRGMIAEAGAD